MISTRSSKTGRKMAENSKIAKAVVAKLRQLATFEKTNLWGHESYTTTLQIPAGFKLIELGYDGDNQVSVKIVRIPQA